MPFFIENKDLFQLEPSNGLGLRKCQLGAIWALKVISPLPVMK